MTHVWSSVRKIACITQERKWHFCVCNVNRSVYLRCHTEQNRPNLLRNAWICSWNFSPGWVDNFYPTYCGSLGFKLPPNKLGNKDGPSFSLQIFNTTFVHCHGDLCLDLLIERMAYLNLLFEFCRSKASWRQLGSKLMRWWKIEARSSALLQHEKTATN